MFSTAVRRKIMHWIMPCPKAPFEAAVETCEIRMPSEILVAKRLLTKTCACKGGRQSGRLCKARVFACIEITSVKKKIWSWILCFFTSSARKCTNPLLPSRIDLTARKQSMCWKAKITYRQRLVKIAFYIMLGSTIRAQNGRCHWQHLGGKVGKSAGAVFDNKARGSIYQSIAVYMGRKSLHSFLTNALLFVFAVSIWENSCPIVYSRVAPHWCFENRVAIPQQSTGSWLGGVSGGLWNADSCGFWWYRKTARNGGKSVWNCKKNSTQQHVFFKKKKQKLQQCLIEIVAARYSGSISCRAREAGVASCLQTMQKA